MHQNTIEVFLNEEYGYKKWIWTPNMGEEEFVAWWGDLTESMLIKYYFNIKTLPGTLKPYIEKNSGSAIKREYGDPTSHTTYYYCHFHDTDDSYIVVGKDTHKFRNRSRFDWKEYWSVHTIKREKIKHKSFNHINP